MTSLIFLPFELITEILLRLPVKTLLCCRSVSKRWRSTIDDPRFSKLHLLSPSSSSYSILFLRHSSHLFTSPIASLDLCLDVTYPLMCYGNYIKLIGTCNGLVCLANVSDDVIVWNPSTRRYRFLPHFPIRGHKDDPRPLAMSLHVHGFGYDEVSDDYVLIRLFQYAVDPFESEVSVYSLRSNRWRRVNGVPYSLIYPRKAGVYACGFLHWIMTRELRLESDNLVVAMNLNNTSVRVMDVPDGVDRKMEMDVSAVGGMPCLVVNGIDICVWVMRQYGKKESWSKLFSIPQPEVRKPDHFIKPMAYSKDGQRILVRQDSKNLIWYNLKNKKIERVKIEGMPKSFEAEVCLSTLVSVDDYGNISNEKHVAMRNKESRTNR